MGRGPEELTDDEQARLSRAHHRLRNASQALEGLTAPPRQRGRWEPRPATGEALEAARSELLAAWEELLGTETDLFG